MIQRRKYPVNVQENAGMGLNRPVLNPGPMGAADQSQPPQPPPMQPRAPSPMLSPTEASTPGGGGENSDELMQMLMKMFGGRGY